MNRTSRKCFKQKCIAADVKGLKLNEDKETDALLNIFFKAGLFALPDEEIMELFDVVNRCHEQIDRFAPENEDVVKKNVLEVKEEFEKLMKKIHGKEDF